MTKAASGAAIARLLALLAFVHAGLARAHDADIVYAQLAPEGEGRLRETFTLTGAALLSLAPADADGNGLLTQAELDSTQPAIVAGVWAQAPLYAGSQACVLQRSASRLRDTYVELTADFSCPAGELRQVFRFLSVLPSGFRVIAGKTGQERFAEGNAQTIVFTASQPAARVQGLGEWITLGVFHIFTGIDHLAFLAALLLVCASARKLLLLVTSFTLAHSLTLGASALGWIVLAQSTQRYVEAAIAATIVFVAAENLLRREHRHRALITFLFGLIHGFGFASVLRSYGVEQSALKALFGFNLGVELGQVCFVLVLFPVLRWIQNLPRAREWVVRSVSVIILVAGGYWLTERLFS